MNGGIYDPSIRTSEYSKVVNNFIRIPQTEPNHLRLGYIVDTSYIGRGNGKSAFIVNLQKEINSDFAHSLSDGKNKCFSIRLRPEGGGSVKTFEKFVESFVLELFESTIIEDTLAALRLEAIINIFPDFPIDEHFHDDDDYRSKLADERWYKFVGIDYRKIAQQIMHNEFLHSLPSEFPLYHDGQFIVQVSKKEDFLQYYNSLKRGKQQSDFVFTHLVNMFLAARFNGAYVFVDDFERIPDFQSGTQKKDFATQLRTYLFDGSYVNASIGFYNFILVLHAGVQGMIQEAWELSGLEHRSPLRHQGAGNEPSHIILFEKISTEDTYSLVTKYLESYRTKDMNDTHRLFPFRQDTISKIAELNEFNCTRILKTAYEILNKAADEGLEEIGPDFVVTDEEDVNTGLPNRFTGIHNAPTKNLLDED